MAGKRPAATGGGGQAAHLDHCWVGKLHHPATRILQDASRQQSETFRPGQVLACGTPNGIEAGKSLTAVIAQFISLEAQSQTDSGQRDDSSHMTNTTEPSNVQQASGAELRASAYLQGQRPLPGDTVVVGQSDCQHATPGQAALEAVVVHEQDPGSHRQKRQSCISGVRQMATERRAGIVWVRLQPVGGMVGPRTGRP